MKFVGISLSVLLAVVYVQSRPGGIAGPPAGPPLGGHAEESLADNCVTPKCPANATDSSKPVILPYPLDCFLYVQCAGSEQHVLPCPADKVFNKKIGQCDTMENAKCVPCYQEAPST